MRSFYEITVGNSERVVTVAEAASREITISGKSYVVPSGVVVFIEELAGEVQRQEVRKAATDKEIAERIDKRIDQLLKALDQHGLLIKHLDEQFPLPPGVEAREGSWTVKSEARTVAKSALKNDYGASLEKELVVE